ncbi:hypothetical protein IJG91_00570 [Candidatus Saccharibacteria bacterium]|nr:hypothetical protein [Candidatus Saccharibacteria bacterium]
MAADDEPLVLPHHPDIDPLSPTLSVSPFKLRPFRPEKLVPEEYVLALTAVPLQDKLPLLIPPAPSPAIKKLSIVTFEKFVSIVETFTLVP